MFSHSDSVRLHVAPLLVVLILIYYTIPVYAGFGAKVTFENRTGDSQLEGFTVKRTLAITIRIFNGSLCGTSLV